MMLTAMLAATAILAGAAPAGAPAAATVSPAVVTGTTSKAEAEKPHLVCKTETLLGSMVPKKTCYMSDTIAQRTADDKQYLQKLQREIPMQVH